jgi:hypothetical protein
MAAKRKAKRKRQRHTVRNYAAALWTVPMCHTWSGLPHQKILDLIHDGQVKAIATGRERDEMGPHGKIRHRACNKYLVPAKEFRAFIARLGTSGRLMIGENVA